MTEHVAGQVDQHKRHALQPKCAAVQRDYPALQPKWLGLRPKRLTPQGEDLVL